jgi:hypothetical protein
VKQNRVACQDYSPRVDKLFDGLLVIESAGTTISWTTATGIVLGRRHTERKTMISKTKIALIAAIAAVGIATPALADGVPVIPQYSLPSEAPGFGAAPALQRGKAVVHGRALYNSAVVPTYGNQNYQSSNYNNWASDSEWSTTGRQNSGH